MHKRVMVNYREACRRRLELWLGAEVSVELRGSELLVSHGGKAVRLGFVSSNCSWWMEFQGERHTGNFDRLSKGLRQIFTS